MNLGLRIFLCDSDISPFVYISRILFDESYDILFILL